MSPLPQAQVATETQTGNECKALGAGVTGRWGRGGGEGPLVPFAAAVAMSRAWA